MSKTRRAALATTLLSLMLGMVALALPSQATTTPAGPSFATCPNLKDWYANPDEQAFLPEPTAAGLKFEGKDLIHHGIGTPIDFADMDKVVYGFAASTPGKVVFKVETSTPYSTIVTNVDGKIWSTAMLPDQVGGQSSPVAKYTDLLDKPVKPGKVAFTGASRVATFGVGYWEEAGSTVVSSISFHGTTYPLTCMLTSPSPSVSSSSASASPSASASSSATPKPSASASVRPSSPTASPAPSDSASPSDDVPPPGDGTSGGSLPLTGPGGGGPVLAVSLGLGLIAAGIGVFLLTRRRRASAGY